MKTEVIERIEAVEAPQAAQEAAGRSLTERQIYNRLRKLEAIEAQIDALEKQKAELRAEIIGEAQEVTIDNTLYSVQYRQIVSRRFDSKAFSAAHPKLYEEFKKPSASSRFTYKFK